MSREETRERENDRTTGRQNDRTRVRKNDRTIGEFYKEFITNSIYQELCDTSERTASRDLENLTVLNVFKKFGEKKGTRYKLKYGG